MPSLALPYETHPEFQFDVSRVRVQPETIQAFNDAYLRAENRDDPSEKQQLAGDARASLRAVFAEVRAQASEPLFREFVDDLERRSLRLLDDDLAHFLADREPISVADEAEQAKLEQLRSRRFFLERLSDACRDELLAVVRASVERFRENAAKGALTREDLSINEGPVVRDVIRSLNHELDTRGINRVVSAYASKEMHVVGVAVELSVPAAEWWRSRYDLPRPPQTLYAHTDETLDTPKSIVYLSDVGEGQGGTSVYPHAEERLGLTPIQKVVGRIAGAVGSDPASPLYSLYKRSYHQGFSSKEFRRHFAMLPAAMQYNSHFGWDVIPDSDLERALVAGETPVRGPAGTFVVFDGARLLHRGGMVTSGERLALQVVFGRRRTLFERVAALARRRLGLAVGSR